MSIELTAPGENEAPKWFEEDPKMFAKLISTQQSIASSVFSTTARVNETNLRKIQRDKLQDLLDAIHEEDEPSDQHEDDGYVERTDHEDEEVEPEHLTAEDLF